MAAKSLLRVAINAQFEPGTTLGGIESVLFGLTKALGELDGGSEEYVFIAAKSAPDLLKPYLGPNQKIVAAPGSPTQLLRRLLKPLKPLLLPLWEQAASRVEGAWPQVPLSSGFYEGLGCDLIHFPYQEFVLCAMPAIYNPHDLQHRHYPAYFSPREIARREAIYSSACHLAQTVAVCSDFVRNDIIAHYRVDPGKIQVIPFAPVTEAYPEPGQDLTTAVRAKYGLEEPFAFYPAVFWPHKNHSRLFEALALLRDRENLNVNLVCTGGNLDEAQRRRVADLLRDLHIENRVKFLGWTPPADLRAVYRLAQFVVVPTLFEAASGPVFEAWREDVPVACSTVTSLPEQAGGAALLFDPTSVTSIADAVAKMSCDAELREKFRMLGRLRLKDFSWERTAKAYRAVYRRAAGRRLSEEEQWLLNLDWTKHRTRQPATV